MSQPELKALQGVEIKNAHTGRVEAVFSTFNVKDHDGDVTLPGAFDNGAPVRISAFGHASWGPSRGSSGVPMPPVGKGVIRTTDSEAILDGQFFLKTAGGRDTFELIKEMGDLQEWSYGFDIVTKQDDGDWEGGKARILEKLKVHEVSPVLLGAGIDTRTVAVKNETSATGVALEQGMNISFPEQFEHVLGDVNELFTRVKGWGLDADTKAGRQLSAANRERIQTVMGQMRDLMTEMDQMLADNDPQKHAKDLWQEVLRFEHLRAQLT